ncbi:hypothetical protein C8J56DRAFT_1170912 [Mycena floridula]|nr:hypothetical protein C8J56DRAFT_1170912 [Mycena floridula]
MRSSSTFVVISLLASIAVVAAAPYESELYARNGQLVARKESPAQKQERLKREEEAKAAKAKQDKIEGEIKNFQTDKKELDTARGARNSDRAAEQVSREKLIKDAKAGTITVAEVNAEQTLEKKVTNDNAKVGAERTKTRADRKTLLASRDLFARVDPPPRGRTQAAVNLAHLGQVDNSIKQQEAITQGKINKDIQNGQIGKALDQEVKLKSEKARQDKVEKKERVDTAIITRPTGRWHAPRSVDLLLEARAHRIHARALEAEYLEARDAQELHERDVQDLEERDESESELVSRGFWEEIDELD